MKKSSFIEPVIAHARFVRKHGVRADGESPLLVDGLDLATLAPPPPQEGYLSSNLACQQNFLRTLDALGTLTGDTSYHRQADEWIHCALDKLRDPASGLLYWGGHASFDLLTDQPIWGHHELKCAYPHYAYLYRVNPDTLRGFVEAFWHAHIWDWSTLLFNRHGRYVTWEKKWETGFSGGPLPIIENTALSFINTGSDLIVSGALLHALSGDEQPLRWAQHLLSRYDQVRHPTTGLGGYQFNYRDPCRVRQSFTPPFDSRADINEATVLKKGLIRTRYGQVAVAFLNVADALGAAKGRPFVDFVAADLEALATHLYDRDAHCFHAALIDGERLNPSHVTEGAGYCTPSDLEPLGADALMFLAYARAYQATQKPLLLDMAKHLAAGLGWGDMSQPVDFAEVSARHSVHKRGTGILPVNHGRDAHATMNLVESVGGGNILAMRNHAAPGPVAGGIGSDSGQRDVCALLGLLALYRATEESVWLVSAESLGQHLLRHYTVGDFIVSATGKTTSNFDSALPLALLHLATAQQGHGEPLPAFYPNHTYFSPKGGAVAAG